MSDPGYKSGDTIGGKIGCAVAAIIAAPLLLGALVLTIPFGDCDPDCPCHEGEGWRILAGFIVAALLAGLIGLIVRRLVDVFAARSGQRAASDPVAEVRSSPKSGVTNTILIVEDVFDIPSWGGFIVVPGPLIADVPARPEGAVLLRRPDGSTISAVMRMVEVFQTPPPKEWRWVCLLKGLEKAEVPVGTEICVVD